MIRFTPEWVKSNKSLNQKFKLMFYKYKISFMFQRNVYDKYVVVPADKRFIDILVHWYACFIWCNISTTWQIEHLYCLPLCIFQFDKLQRKFLPTNIAKLSCNLFYWHITRTTRVSHNLPNSFIFWKNLFRNSSLG